MPSRVLSQYLTYNITRLGLSGSSFMERLTLLLMTRNLDRYLLFSLKDLGHIKQSFKFTSPTGFKDLIHSKQTTLFISPSSFKELGNKCKSDHVLLSKISVKTIFLKEV
jgi:hypothetical protein